MITAKNCCFCVGLRPGSFVIAVVSLVVSIIFLFFSTLYKDVSWMRYVWIALALFAATLLLFAALYNRSDYFKSYLAIRGLELIPLSAAFFCKLGVLIFIDEEDNTDFTEDAVFTGVLAVYLVLHAYFYIVVYSHYKKLNDSPGTTTQTPDKYTEA